MLLNMLYPVLASPLFAGPQSYIFMQSYCDEMTEILRLPSVRPASPSRCAVLSTSGAAVASLRRR